MKKLILVLILSLLCLQQLVSNAYASNSFSSSEQISLFKSTIELEQNTDINIKEEISYYFPSSDKHGIIREIPTDYKIQAGFKRPTTIKLNSLYYYDKNYPEERYDSYERSSDNGYTIFKIGDAETTITGEYVFVIDYTLQNMINYFDDHDELYINVTGNGWNVPINQAYAEIKLPGDITEKVCYTGIGGSTDTNCTFLDIDSRNTKISANSSLGVYEGLTVALKMPKGTLEDTTTKQRIQMILANLGILLPVPVFFFVNSIVQKKKNKKLTIIPHYDTPKGIYPLLAGHIFNGSLNNKHITAEIIKLAIDGYIKIRRDDENKYSIVRVDTKKEQNETVKELLDGLLGEKDEIEMKKLSSNFYKTVMKLRASTEKQVYEDGYFEKSKSNLKTLFIVIGTIGIFLSVAVLGPVLSTIAATGWTVGVLISFLLVIIWGTMIETRSELGNEILYDLKGLKMYINTAEKYRIEFHNDPKKYIGVFEKLLPFAIIFGLEKKWAKEFEDIYDVQPDWYDGN
ncbi:DUF2207 domain-containing protein, partial [Candidatus Microgenomates bacterium]|nr:DUF2207 domain-containing protein [Candidatus Microgenomates bacterium]